MDKKDNGLKDVSLPWSTANMRDYSLRSKGDRNEEDMENGWYRAIF